MRFGVTVFPTDLGMQPAELARAVEDHGLDSLFVAEHTHIPVSRRTPAPMGEPLPEHYRRLLDPFVALTAMAAATERIRVGTGICLVAERDPLITAKQVASLDLVSGGRFVFGVGFGWNVEELEDHGVAFGDRRDVTRERVLAMKRLWTEDEASFEGEHVRFEPTWSWPKPVQQPHPPVWLGVSPGPSNFEHLAAYADAWIPIGGRGVAEALPDLHRALEAAGRDPGDLEIIPFGSVPDARKFDYFSGELGATEVVAGAPGTGRDELLPFLEHYAGVIEQVRG